jgi:NAD-dependent SIR2 family protein deacetylase
MQHLDGQIKKAIKLLQNSEYLLVGAGAGMGVDSGLPDFRGDKGFWEAYPGFKGRSFSDVAQEINFEKDPRGIWGFYAHRILKYQSTQPHQGYSDLAKLTNHFSSSFVYTSNVDGHFLMNEFQKQSSNCDIYEIHGSINHLQCTHIVCEQPLWKAKGINFEIDTECRLISDIPNCPSCGSTARPNVLMFEDGRWKETRASLQENAYNHWLSKIDKSKVVAVEIGAGTAIPSVRIECSQFPVIRINPRDSDVKYDLSGSVGLRLDAKEALDYLIKAINL